MKTSILAICLVLGVVFAYSFSKAGKVNEKDGKASVKILTGKNGEISIVDTIISFTVDFNESLINDLLKIYGVDEKGENVVKNIFVCTNEDSQNKYMKFVSADGDTIMAQISNCCSVNGDSLKRCCQEQTGTKMLCCAANCDSFKKCNFQQSCTNFCDGKDGSKSSNMILQSCSGNSKELKNGMCKVIIIEGNEAGSNKKFKIICLSGDFSCTKICNDKSGINQKNICDRTATKCCIESGECSNKNVNSEKQDIPSFNTENNLKIERLEFYPNPNNGKFNLNFVLPEKGNTKITVFDSDGKEVYKEALSGFTGEYNKSIDISAEGKGIYLLNVEQGDKVINRKLIVK